MDISEKAAWLKGLAEGLELDTDTKERKLISAMVEVIGEMALELRELREGQAAFSDQLDSVTGDLEDVESVVFGDADDDETAHYAAACPHCQETVYFDESLLEGGQILCPNCGHQLEFELKDDGDEPDAIL